MVRLPIRFLKINEDIAIWSAPLELFCEISNEIRDRSPFPYTFYYGYTNGWLGYLLTESEYKYKGYEPTVSPFTPGAERDLTEAVVTHLQGKMQNNELVSENDIYIQSQTKNSLMGVSYETKPTRLSDGKGSLSPSYDTGDGVHETTSARQIIANEWIAKIIWYNDRK
jgi:hypothetical protein